MFLLLSATFLILLVLHQVWFRRRGFPSGPVPFPIIGNFPSFMFSKRWEYKFLEWKNKYGPIYTLWLGFKPVITINDYETAVKLFVNESDAYSDRAHVDEFTTLTRGGNFGILQTSGTLWQEQRRAAIKVLRDFGMGKNLIQDRILAEVDTICSGINKDLDSGVVEIEIIKYTDIAVGSLINSLILGYRFTENNKAEEFYKLRACQDELTELFTDPLFNMCMFNPLLQKLPLIRNRFLQFNKLFQELMDFIRASVNEHKKLNDYTNTSMEPKDFVDAYQIEMFRANESGTKHYYSDQQCLNIVADFWAAGQGTTSTTTQWAIAYMICHPVVQKKLQDEFDRVIGNDRIINLSDKSSLPYFNATVTEVQRHLNLLPINLPHSVARDVELNGHLIKKGTTVFPQISVIMSDPKYFPEPKKFMPERFIDEKGQFLNNEKVLPFSLGKRICPGEGLARAELFLILSNLFNQFQFFAASKPPTLERCFGGGSTICRPYKCQVVKRF